LFSCRPFLQNSLKRLPAAASREVQKSSLSFLLLVSLSSCSQTKSFPSASESFKSLISCCIRPGIPLDNCWPRVLLLLSPWRHLDLGVARLPCAPFSPPSTAVWRCAKAPLAYTARPRDTSYRPKSRCFHCVFVGPVFCFSRRSTSLPFSPLGRMPLSIAARTVVLIFQQRATLFPNDSRCTWATFMWLNVVLAQC